MTWAKPRKEPTQSTYTPRPRAVAVSTGVARMVVPVPKEAPVRDESYRRQVAALPCAHCGLEGYSQAAHGDQGKGMSLKSSDDTCYPACGPHMTLFGMVAGCHHDIGTAGMDRDERRALEARYAAETRKQLGRE